MVISGCFLAKASTRSRSDRKGVGRAASGVRDTTDRDGGTLGFTTEAWQEFADSFR
jgi:hypothetical protein